MNKILTLFISLYILLLASCAAGGGNTVEADGQEVEMKYATRLTLRHADGFTLAEVRNPWDTTAVLHRYVLVPSGAPLPKELPAGDVVRTPLRNAAVTTSVHCGLMGELGAADAIKGVCDLEYINLTAVRQGVECGSIKDLGSSMTPNIELLMAMHPDAIFISPFENSGSYGKLGKLRIPIIECADYMETNPLGRAEWIRFYGALLGKEREADSIFAAVEEAYTKMKALAAQQQTRPTVVTEMKIGSTWYVAGGNSTVGILIRDAGGSYIFSDVASGGAVPYSPEQVFDKAQKADYWLIKYNQATDMTLRELSAAWTSNKYMEAYKRGRVYGCNLSKTRFFEETPFHPDILLKEYIHILHPDIALPYADTQSGGKTYFKRIQP